LFVLLNWFYLPPLPQCSRSHQTQLAIYQERQANIAKQPKEIKDSGSVRKFTTMALFIFSIVKFYFEDKLLLKNLIYELLEQKSYIFRNMAHQKSGMLIYNHFKEL